MSDNDLIPELYWCDPNKHKECSKSGCYINGGECYRTTHKEYALEEKSNPKVTPEE